MSAAHEPMTFDELSELYRVEMKSNALTQVRPDLFRAVADLLSRLRVDYDKQMSLDPESVMTEGANQRRKKAERLCKDVMHLRTQKICQMAIRGAMGANNSLEGLTDEEKDLYESIKLTTGRHLGEVDRLRGRRNTVDTRIDNPVFEAAPAPRPEPVPEPEPVRPAPVEEEEASMEDIPYVEDEFVSEESFDDIPDDDSAFFADAPVQEPVASPLPVEKEPASENSEMESVLIRILEDLPPFVGPDRDYSLVKEDLVTMPRVMADALVNSQKAVVVRPSP